MKCPHCGLIVTDQLPECRGCGFGLKDLDRKLLPVPKRIGFVNDFAKFLSKEQRDLLEGLLAQYPMKRQGELVLVTVDSTRPAKPSEYAFWLFNRWRIGGEAHTGLLVLLSRRERRIECEVGYGWEPIIDDAASGKVLDEAVLPLLKQNEFYQALQNGMTRLAEIIAQGIAAQKDLPEGSPPEEGKGL